jgi:hypothetical protein
MANDNEVEGLPEGATVRPVQQPKGQTSGDEIEGLPEGATVRPIPPVQPTRTTKLSDVEGLPEGATLRALPEKPNAKTEEEKPLLDRTLDVAGSVTKPLISLYHGLSGHEETPEERGETTTLSPVGSNLGFKPTHMAHAAGEMVRGVAGSLYDVGHDILATKTPILIPDKPDTPDKPEPGWSDPKAHTLVAKYITAPSMAEREASEKEMEEYFETNGAEATGHALAAIVHGTLGEYVPAVGPLAAQIMDKARSGDIGGALSQIAALYASAKAAPKALEKGTELVKRGAETTPVLRSLADVVTTDKYKLGRKVAEAQRAFDKAYKDIAPYKSSTAQGVKAPAEVQEAFNKARNDLAVAKFHQEVAPSLQERAGTAAQQIAYESGKRAPAGLKRIVMPGEAPEIPSEDITAQPSPLRPLSSNVAPAKPINVKTPGEIKPEVINPKPVEETLLDRPRVRQGRTALANDQGIMGALLSLPAATEEPLIPEKAEVSAKPKAAPESRAESGTSPPPPPSELKPLGRSATPPTAESPSTKPKNVERVLRESLGGAEPLIKDVPLRNQGAAPKGEPQRLSSEPRKAALQKAGATEEEIATILPKGVKPGQVGLTKVEMSRLAEHFGVDLGDKAIGRGKGDIAAGTHFTQAEVLQKILDGGAKPSDIARAIDAGKHLPGPVSGGNQSATPDIHSIASDFTRKLIAGGAEVPTEVEHTGGSAGTSIRRSGLTPISFDAAPRVEATPEELEIAARRELAPRIGDENRAARAKEEAKLTQLQDIRKRLGLKSSESRAAQPETLGSQSPIHKAPERLAERAGTTYSVKSEEGDLNNHVTVEGKSAAGRITGKVSAISTVDAPDTFIVHSSEAEGGKGIGREAYFRLTTEMQRRANSSGRLITLRGDSVQSDAAKYVWKNDLEKSGLPVKWNKQGVPSIEFTPKTKTTALGMGRRSTEQVAYQHIAGNATLRQRCSVPDHIAPP